MKIRSAGSRNRSTSCRNPPGATEGGQPAGEQPTGDQANAQQILDDANKALETGDFQTALSSFDKLVIGVERSNHPNAYGLLPIVYTGRARAWSGLRNTNPPSKTSRSARHRSTRRIRARQYRSRQHVFGARRGRPVAARFPGRGEGRRSNSAQFGLGKAMILLGGAQQGIGPLTRVIVADPKMPRPTGFAASATRAR